VRAVPCCAKKEVSVSNNFVVSFSTFCSCGCVLPVWYHAYSAAVASCYLLRWVEPAKHSLAPSDRAALVHVDGGCQRTRTFPSGQGKFWHFFFLGLPTRVGPHPTQLTGVHAVRALVLAAFFFPRTSRCISSVMSSSRVRVWEKHAIRGGFDRGLGCGARALLELIF
jgi:hypothetical protein